MNNVNNYYCQFTNGKVKSKGFYLSNEKFGKATSKILCNMVTHKPLLDGTVPGDYVIYKRHGVGEIYDAKTNTKLEGRSLAFVIGYPDDERTGAFYSRSRNQRETVVKDEKGKAVIDEKTVVFNFAAVHRTPGHPDYAYFETNIKGAENVCNFATAHGINHIVFTSSIAPYGASEEQKTEEIPARRVADL